MEFQIFTLGEGCLQTFFSKVEPNHNARLVLRIEKERREEKEGKRKKEEGWEEWQCWKEGAMSCGEKEEQVSILCKEWKFSKKGRKEERVNEEIKVEKY